MPAIKHVPKNAETVTIACKIPMGLHLDIALPGEGEDFERVTIAGSNHPEAVCGYGMTRVSKDFAQEWLTTNARHPAVAKGLVFMHKDERSARSEANEKKELRSGLEGIEPKDVQTGQFKIMPEAYEGKPE
jgi:hypothetical protein